MKSKSLCFVLAFITLVCNTAVSQRSQKMIEHDVIAGTITKDGKQIAGYLKLMGTESLMDENFSAPWDFQRDIRFMEKSAFDNAEKVRVKDFEKLGADEIEGYTYNNDSLVYESAKYADMSAVGAGMIAKKMFLRKVSTGKISLYHHFALPPAAGEVTNLKEIYLENANPNLVYRIGADGKLKLVNSLNVKKELTDCPAVVEKFEKGEYGMEGSAEKKGLAKLADKTVNRDAIRLAVIDDYNATCGTR
jgi:hypothetical protein